MPFTRDAFLDAFARYNEATWPVPLMLWIATAAMLALAARWAPFRRAGLSALLAVHWIWAALAYHAAFFSDVTGGAWIYAALFTVQSALFVRRGMMKQELEFMSRRDWHGVAGGMFILAALAYPLAGLRDFPRAPSFGVPCPTVILTAGLLLTQRQARISLSLIPIAWSAIGGSAAIMLGIPADFALAAAGLTLAAAHLVRPPVTRRPLRLRAGPSRTG